MTQREMAESHLQSVRIRIRNIEADLAKLKAHEAECVKALAEENGQVNRVAETAGVS